jgi:hypothetical protein
VAFAVADASAASMVGGLAAIVFVHTVHGTCRSFCVLSKAGVCVCMCMWIHLPQHKGKCQGDIGLLGAWLG